MTELLLVPAARREAIMRLSAELRPGMTVALSTHINADGDGCGSQTALARLLGQIGIRAIIVNPTPWPEMFRWLLGDDVDERSTGGAKAIAKTDRVIVLDISDLGRLGNLADAVRAMPQDALVIDHHLPGNEPPGKTMLSDTAACATAELVYDFAKQRGLSITPAVAKSLYTGLVTDTGGFRFGNTSPRCLAVAADLLTVGVDPELMYQHIYGSVPLGRLHLLRDALETLETDMAHGIAWVRIAAGALEKHGVAAEDLDGISEYPRSVAGIRLAVMFRDLGHGKVKVSFRSVAGVNVNTLARSFGGGGHARASGALIAGGPAEVEERVLGEARHLLETGALAD